MSEFIANVAAGVWTPVLFLLILGGLFFFIYSRLLHYKYFTHSIAILRGKYHDPKDPGQISPYEALSTALASTVGMGNIAGVAAAISLGGPGALFLDVGNGICRDEYEFFYEYTFCDVSRKRFGRGDSRRPHVCDPRGTWQKVETTFCTILYLRHGGMLAHFSSEPVDIGYYWYWC